MRAYLRPILMITLVSLMLTAVAYADGDSQGGGEPSVRGPILDISHFDVILLMISRRRLMRLCSTIATPAALIRGSKAFGW